MSEPLTQPQRATPKPVSDKGSGLPPGMVGRGRVSTIYIVVPRILEARISGGPEDARAAGVSRGRETLKSTGAELLEVVQCAGPLNAGS